MAIAVGPVSRIERIRKLCSNGFDRSLVRQNSTRSSLRRSESPNTTGIHMQQAASSGAAFALPARGLQQTPRAHLHAGARRRRQLFFVLHQCYTSLDNRPFSRGSFKLAATPADSPTLSIIGPGLNFPQFSAHRGETHPPPSMPARAARMP